MAEIINPEFNDKNTLKNKGKNNTIAKPKSEFSVINSNKETHENRIKKSQNSDKVTTDLPKEALLSTSKPSGEVVNLKAKSTFKNLLGRQTLSGLVCSIRKKTTTKKKSSFCGFQQNPLLTDSDLRNEVFVSPRSSDMMQGLRVANLTNQSIFGNFLLGIAVGAVFALLLKLAYEMTEKIVNG